MNIRKQMPVFSSLRNFEPQVSAEQTPVDSAAAGQTGSPDWVEVRRQARLPAAALVAVAGLFFVLHLTGLTTEDLQTYLFPVFLLAFLFLFHRLQFRIPALAVGLVLSVWAFDGLHVRGYLGPGGAAAYFARLENDPTGLVGRGVMLRINHIAETYDLSTLLPVQRQFSSTDEAGDWIAAQSESPAVITGQRGLFRLQVSPRLDRDVAGMLSRFRRVAPESSGVEALLKSFGIDPQHGGIVVTIPGSRMPVILVSSPETISIPGEPVEMNRHYLAWLLNGLLRLSESDPGPAIRQLGLKKKELFSDLTRLPAAVDAFNEAGKIVGDWPTPIPVITARFYLGTMLLVEGIDGRLEPAAIEAADQAFKSASGYARRENSDPVSAALWNNHAITRLLLMSDEDDLREIKRWLLRAAVMDEQGRPVRAARAAMVNLILLGRAGL